MSTFSAEKLIKKTRKRHHCFGCELVFESGTRLYKCVDNYEDFHSYYLCLICRDFLSLFPNICDIEQGELHEKWLRAKYGNNDEIIGFLDEAEKHRRASWYKVVPFKRWKFTKETGYQEHD